MEGFTRMNEHTQLIVMLTHHDQTVKNAYEIFDNCKDSKAKFWGFKDSGIPLDEMKALYAYMKACGKTTVLEVVEYTEAEGLAGAQMALDCGVDILMGTIFSDSIHKFCQENNLKYMPFVGTVTQRPSVLNGSAKEMIAEANCYLEKGVYGIDLLGYRHTGDASAIIKEFVTTVNAPVCVAGDVNSYQRIDEVKDFGAAAFTIGSAFFENKFEGSFKEQVNKVCQYINCLEGVSHV